MIEADNPTRTMSNANLRSIFLMVSAMGCFTLVDLLIKIASQTLPVGQVMMTLGAGSTAVFVLLIIARGEAVSIAPLRQPAMLLRNAGDILAGITMSLALAYIPISIIGAIIQAVPLMLFLSFRKFLLLFLPVLILLRSD